jgi:hypothetical protein
MMDAGHLDFGHLLETILGGTVPILIYIASNKRKAKQDNDKRHEDSQKLIADLATRAEYLPFHGHDEREGPLCAEGIRWGPDKGNR